MTIKKKSISFVFRRTKYFGLAAILVGIFIYSGCYLFPNYEGYVNSTIKPMRIRGTVIGKAEEQTGCYGLIIFKQAQELDTLRKIHYCTPPVNGVWRYVEPGDSILKDAGTLEINVKRNGTSQKFIFATKIPL